MCANYPENEEKFGEIIALILGAYRAHAEFSIPASKTSLNFSKKSDEDFLVFAFGEKQRTNLQDKLYPTETVYTYISNLNINKNGLINFNELRKIWDLISKEENGIIAAQVICTEYTENTSSLSATLQKYISKENPITFIVQRNDAIDMPHFTLVDFENPY
jgi:hypothetical protein